MSGPRQYCIQARLMEMGGDEGTATHEHEPGPIFKDVSYGHTEEEPLGHWARAIGCLRCGVVYWENVT